MGELYLAVLDCKRAWTSLEVSCAVALGNTYLRTTVPSNASDSFRRWHVPNVFSVCTISVVADDTSLGTVSVPAMSLRKRMDETLDEWYAVTPVDAGGEQVSLHLLLHFRQFSKGDEPKAPETFCSRFFESTQPPSTPAPIPETHASAPGASSNHSTEKQPGATIPPRPALKEPWDDEGKELLSRLHACCAELEEQQAACAAAELSSTSGEEFDTASLQMLSQEAAMQREMEELHVHWHVLSADRDSRKEAGAGGATASRRAREELQEMESALVRETDELQMAQQESAEHLAVRRQLQQEVRQYVHIFNSEMDLCRRHGSHLIESRSELRQAAVGLGRELQASVFEADELASHALHLECEVTAAEQQTIRLRRLRQQLSTGGVIAEIEDVCTRLQARADESCCDTAQSEEAEEMHLLDQLEEQDREILILQQVTQKLSGAAYMPGPEPPDDLDLAVRASFKTLQLEVAPPLLRLDDGQGDRPLFLFETVECEAQQTHEGVKFRMVDRQPSTTWAPLGGIAGGMCQDGAKSGSEDEALWLTAGQLVQAVGWTPATQTF